MYFGDPNLSVCIYVCRLDIKQRWFHNVPLDRINPERTYLSKIEDYPAFLEACWREHLEPKANDAPTVISLFAGCGGFSLGHSMAGYRELLAVEWDDHAVETFKLNFPDVPVWHGAIADLSVFMKAVAEYVRFKLICYPSVRKAV